MHFYGVVFTGRTLRQSGTPDTEVTEVGFFPLNRLPEALFEPDRPVLEDAERPRPEPYLR